MKTSLRFCFVALALGLALFPLAGRAAGPTPEMRLDRLDQLVGLTSDQKSQAIAVFKREDAELAALPQDQRPARSMDVRQDSRDRVRALLTPTQQHLYDRTQTGRGGGLTLPTPEAKLARLNETVGLTPDQQPLALAIFQAEFDGLVALPPADRVAKGAIFRQTAQDQVRELLTPPQLDKMYGARNAAQAQDTAERTALTNLLRASPAIAARVGAIVSVSAGGSSSTTEGSDGSRSGNAQLRVVGATSSEMLKVFWDTDPSSRRIRIVRIEASSGETIQL